MKLYKEKAATEASFAEALDIVAKEGANMRKKDEGNSIPVVMLPNIYLACALRTHRDQNPKS